MKKIKLHRYQVLPIAIAIYATAMAWIGRGALFNPNARLTYILSVLAEIIIIILLYFFLRKRDKIRRKKDI
jgi:hypothetical protein